MAVYPDHAHRGSWTFQYTVAALVAACSLRASFHTQRRDYWLAEFEKIKGKLPNTITIDAAEEFAKSMSLSNSSYGRPSLKLDPELEREFHRAVSRVQHHRRELETFTRWVAVLTPDKQDRVMDLTIDDVEFFSLHDKDLSTLVKADTNEEE